MRRDFSKAELQAILNAEATQGLQSSMTSGVSFSSTDILPGQVFFALKGAKVHGHQFAKDALNKKASFVVVEDRSFLNDQEIADRVLLVSDTLKALHQVTAVVRNAFKGKVLGVIGSVGKTSTKDITAGIAKKFVNCCNSVKSFNTNIGIPFTICNADVDADLWVLELGMNHPGELKELSEIAKPDALLVTQIAPEHMEFFKSIDEVADAEFEALIGLVPNSPVFLCSEDHHAAQGLERNSKRYGCTPKAFNFGSSSSADLRYSKFEHKFGALLEGSFELSYRGERVPVLTQLIGAHNAQNFAGAALALLTLCPNIKLSELPAVIRSLEPSPMRLNQVRLNNGPLIIDDTYNSSPEAVEKALDIVREIKQRGQRVGIVLGDMRELGDKSLEYHLGLGQFVKNCRPEFFVGVGEYSMQLAKSIGKDCTATGVENVAMALPIVAAQLAKVDVILMKASRGVGLDQLVKKLKTPPQNHHVLS